MIDFPILGGFTAYFISFFVDEIQYLFIVLLTKKEGLIESMQMYGI